MGFDPVSAVIGLVDKGLDKFVRDKMSEKDQEQLKTDLAMFVAGEARNENSAFRAFVVAYEGAAKDVPRFIVVLRASIRPLFTILVAWLDFLYFNSQGWTPEQGDLLKSVNVIVLFFWFGERAVTNSGIVEKLLAKKK